MQKAAITEKTSKNKFPLLNIGSLKSILKYLNTA